MAQYLTGTIAVTNGSATVTGTGTAWQTAAIPAGAVLYVGTQNVPYVVASVLGEVSIQLSAPYQEATASGQSYSLNSDFLPNTGAPIIVAGDVHTAQLVTRAITQLDTALANLTGSVTAWLDGTVSLPGASFASDLDTGLWRPGANILAASTGGVEAMRIDDAQNIGIGTDNPHDSAGFERIIDLNGANGAAVYTRTAESATQYTMFGNFGQNGFFRNGGTGFFNINTNGAERLRVLSTGVIDIKAAGSAAAPALILNGDSNTGLFHAAADTLGLATNGVEALRIDSLQRLLGVAGTAARPTFSFAADTDTGIFRGAANQLDFATAGAKVMSIDATAVVQMMNATAPGGTPSGSGYLYVEAGALKFKGSGGTITTIAAA